MGSGDGICPASTLCFIVRVGATYYPASYAIDNIISVAAIDNKGKLATFSNFGVASVQIAAPGVNILSVAKSSSGDWSYEAWSGTSMATPHVSAVAALLKSYENHLNYQDLKNRIIETARPLAQLRGQVSTGGIVDAYAALINKKPDPDLEDPFYWAKTQNQISSIHPYTNDLSQSWEMEVPGAQTISIYFDKIKTEKKFDEIQIYNSQGVLVQSLSGEHNGVFSETIQGDKVKIVLKSDSSITDYGFDISQIAWR